jgi:hypothetical protein
MGVQLDGKLLNNEAHCLPLQNPGSCLEAAASAR